ncbi:MAG: 2-polyprenyl-3-methyl-6-methoxy-1,4-benzoquinone monooxygenase [Pseudomonadales bacterium]|nr:2-polyprenyl-3-methyl-6-methoxy-1,4-benzoquinone monooxygenase [Pseudomonadales bacterium]
MRQRRFSVIDEFLSSFDNSLKTLTKGANQAAREIAAERTDSQLDAKQSKHIAGLMRINHTGEVCAQALYQGQALTAKLETTREAMQQAANEEIDHLVWCEQRIKELGGHTSHLNPLFYGLSFSIGALAGAISDKVSLGFVAATEDQVCKHLQDHLEQIPESDKKTREILEKMLIDEQAHAHIAMQAGGLAFPGPIKASMTLLSKAMTATTYRI